MEISRRGLQAGEHGRGNSEAPGLWEPITCFSSLEPAHSNSSELRNLTGLRAVPFRHGWDGDARETQRVLDVYDVIAIPTAAGVFIRWGVSMPMSVGTQRAASTSRKTWTLRAMQAS